MATQVTNYQCPACTGPLHFVGASGRLECDYCGSVYSVEEIEKLYAEKDEQAAQASQQAQAQHQHAQQQTAQDAEAGWDTSGFTEDWGGANMRAYNCPSCGAELICDETTAATSCPYCGNPTIVPGQFTGAMKPELVIPFTLDKEQAVAALKRHYHGKRLLPKSFTNENHIQEIQGVYVPFWLFDGTVDAQAEYTATRSFTQVTRKERITTTEHFQLHRAGQVTFDKIPVDASAKMPDAHMDAIEPFDYSTLKPFSTAYLPGFLADRYDVSVEDSFPRAEERACRTAYDALAATCVGYETVLPTENRAAELHRGKVHYALLPVWLLNTKWNGQDFLFAVNGQTGKLVGDLPVDRGRYWAWFGGITAGVAAFITLLLTLL